MSRPAVSVRFDANGRTYQPGDTLAGEYRLEGLRAGELRAVEVSVLWHTEGKGDEDLTVHEFKRYSAEEGELPDPARSGRFETVLPPSPLSYDGVLVKVRWCVRVRAFLEGGREVMGERRFQLGRVPPAGRPAP